MSKAFTCKSLKEEHLGRVFQTHQLSDDELQTMLTCREKKEVDFILIDIREIFEFSDLSISGCDLLLPTSTIHMHVDTLVKEYKNRAIVLYCRTGSRTEHMLGILKRMGCTKVAHLTLGITRYSGETLKNAPIPKIN